jgi:hypothetical protein
MAKAAEDTVPMNINYSSGNYSLNPETPRIAKGGTAQIKTSSQAARICFNPTTTPFGSYFDIPANSSQHVPVGDGTYNVGYGLSAYGGPCTAPPPSGGPVLTATGTIKVGS